MHARLLQTTSLLAASTFLISGCTNIKDDQRRTKTEGALAGGVAGAVIGGLIGAASGNRNAVVTGAVAGGAIGTAGGYAYGSHVASKKRGYAANEARLRELIGEARTERRSAEAYNASLRKAITQQRADLERIRAGRANKGDASRLGRNIDGNLSQMQAQYQRKDAVTNEARAALASAPSGPDKQQLQAEYSSLQQEKEVLGQRIREMNGIKTQLANTSR